jgi:hypothetical protein
VKSCAYVRVVRTFFNVPGQDSFAIGTKRLVRVLVGTLRVNTNQTVGPAKASDALIGCNNQVDGRWRNRIHCTVIALQSTPFHPTCAATRVSRGAVAGPGRVEGGAFFDACGENRPRQSAPVHCSGLPRQDGIIPVRQRDARKRQPHAFRMSAAARVRGTTGSTRRHCRTRSGPQTRNIGSATGGCGTRTWPDGQSAEVAHKRYYVVCQDCRDALPRWRFRGCKECFLRPGEPLPRSYRSRPSTSVRGHVRAAAKRAGRGASPSS